MKARVILTDDHPMVRQGVRDLIALTTDMEVVAEASNGVEAEHLARTVPSELMILDIAMPQRSGVQVLEALRADGIQLPVLFFTMTSVSQYAAYVMHLGAQGFIGKEVLSTELLNAMRQILAGGTSFPDSVSADQCTEGGAHATKILSRRESQVLQGMLQGTSQVEIAAELGISAASANTYRRRILEKFGVNSNVELIKFQAKTGL